MKIWNRFKLWLYTFAELTVITGNTADNLHDFNLGQPKKAFLSLVALFWVGGFFWLFLSAGLFFAFKVGLSLWIGLGLGLVISIVATDIGAGAITYVTANYHADNVPGFTIKKNLAKLGFILASGLGVPAGIYWLVSTMRTDITATIVGLLILVLLFILATKLMEWTMKKVVRLCLNYHPDVGLLAERDETE